jgi:photosystem II stability/assembly factor-like uncharacterized protein
MTTSSKIMKNIAITLFLIAMSCGIANAQWTKVYQPDSCDCISGSLTSMAFFGNDSGVVCWGQTSITTDGGNRWQANQRNPIVIEGPGGAFTDINHIWFNYEAFVYYTSDAGKTWVTDTNNDSLGSSANCIYFIDSLVGFEGGPGLLMFRTSDGGKNWQRVHDETDSNYEVNQIQFCSPKVGIATCGQFVSSIARTTDSGKTWTIINQFAGSASRSLSYPDPLDAWFTDGSFLYHSSDSGLTWTTVSGTIVPHLSVGSICFVDSLHGIATSPGLGATYPLFIGYTSDGGKSWQTTSIDSEGAEGFISFPDTNTAYIGGLDAVYKLNVRDLAVQATLPVVVEAKLESEDGNLFIVMPPDAGGNMRIVDALGRTLEEKLLSPGTRTELVSTSPSQPQFHFAEVECNGRIQVFKVLN